MEIRLGSNIFRIGQKIGCGAFSDVHLASNVRTGEEVAVKLESARVKPQTLVCEAMFYQLLDGSPGDGLPTMRWYGVVGDLNVMVMDLLGPSLEDLLTMRQARGKKGLSLRATVQVAMQVLDRLEFIHARNLVHRDVKPENFLLGLHNFVGRVHIIDFGLTKKYRDPKTQQHVPAAEGCQPTGNAMFSSLTADAGAEQGRRDDLEAVGNMLVYLLRGRLPWSVSTRRFHAGWLRTQPVSFEDMRREKHIMSLEALCRKCPAEFLEFLKYCRSLRFDEQPDYAHLRQLLRHAIGPTEVVCGTQEPSLERWLADDSPQSGKLGIVSLKKSSSLWKKELTSKLASGDKVERSLPALLGTLRRDTPSEAGGDYHIVEANNLYVQKAEQAEEDNPVVILPSTAKIRL